MDPIRIRLYPHTTHRVLHLVGQLNRGLYTAEEFITFLQRDTTLNLTPAQIGAIRRHPRFSVDVRGHVDGSVIVTLKPRHERIMRLTERADGWLCHVYGVNVAGDKRTPLFTAEVTTFPQVISMAQALEASIYIQPDSLMADSLSLEDRTALIIDADLTVCII